MAKRVGPPPSGVRFPIWAYFKQQGETSGKPYMRAYRRLYDGPLDCMRLEVDEARALLSDEDDWHFPLNYWYLSASRADSDAFDDWVASLGVGFRSISDWSQDSPALREVRRCVEDSWSLMFDLDGPRDEYGHFPSIKRSYQATFWELRREDVVSVEHFRGTRKP